MAAGRSVGPEELAEILSRTRVSKHQHTLRDFHETGEPARFYSVPEGGKVTGLQSGLSGAKRQLSKKGEKWADDIKVSASEAKGGVYLIRADIVAEAKSGMSEAAPTRVTAEVG